MKFGRDLEKEKEIDFPFRKSREGKEARAIKQISETQRKFKAHISICQRRENKARLKEKK